MRDRHRRTGVPISCRRLLCSSLCGVVWCAIVSFFFSFVFPFCLCIFLASFWLPATPVPQAGAAVSTGKIGGILLGIAVGAVVAALIWRRGWCKSRRDQWRGFFHGNGNGIGNRNGNGLHGVRSRDEGNREGLARGDSSRRNGNPEDLIVVHCVERVASLQVRRSRDVYHDDDHLGGSDRCGGGRGIGRGGSAIIAPKVVGLGGWIGKSHGGDRFSFRNRDTAQFYEGCVFSANLLKCGIII
mmetsp:Transcript_18484/g.42506  ORF Transcript_18484/g.42506 Transcript_18484/m.42506 type:complete len:242 (+) Transcript_18484:82-807(+)